MYKTKVTEEERERIASGNVEILLKKLQLLDAQVTKELKKDKSGNVAFLQGISCITDDLIAILTRA